MSARASRVQAVGTMIAECAESIAAQFKPSARVTILVRHPSHLDGSRDVVITSDALDEVILALQIRSRAERAPVYEAPRDMSVPLRVRGVGRVADEPRALLLSLNERPTDDEIRALHDHLSEVVIA